MVRRPGPGDWFDARTGYRALLRHLLNEPLPPGTGWWFVTGSVVLFLLAVQFVTGVALAMYYVPAPEAAYESVRFIVERLSLGSTLRSLHVFGASFIVVAAVVHMLRVVVTGSYKRPRELTWITGVVLLLTILAFALTGYLLPWDQKAYWATTVTINIAANAPGGDWIAGVLRGGEVLGALTLVRWYAVHVFLLPASLIVFTIAHLYLMRRHGISGPVKPRTGAALPFYPYHALKDTIVCAAVFAALLTLALAVPAPLDAMADPTDSSYVPRPEWYFLSLFQLLKYFPGALEPVATMVIPAATVALLLLLPFLDWRAERDPRRRLPVLTAFGVVGLGITVLTLLGHRDAPERTANAAWGLIPLAGHELAQGEACVRCHGSGGPAASLDETPIRRDPGWLLSHIRDPEVIAPGLRTPPPGGVTLAQAQSILSYLRQSRSGAPPPDVPEEQVRIALVFSRYCAACHAIDGDGGAAGPDLTHVGRTRDAEWLKRWLTNPKSVDPAATMPGFSAAMTPDELSAMARYLAGKSQSAAR